MAEVNPNNNPPGGSLRGVRVVDVTIAIAGPSCTMHMADMGAEVIRVENPGAADGADIETPTEDYVNYTGAMYAWRNGGKKCICLDLKKTEAREAFYDLVRVSDVVVNNRKVGVMDRLGIGYQQLRKINPGIIMCSITGFGQFGPLAPRPAYDQMLQGMSGSAWICGEPDRSPAVGWVSWVDSGSGASAFGAICAALYHREKTGEGQHLDISMLEVAFSFHDYPLLEYLWSGGKIQRSRNGSFHPTGSAWGVFRCRDGFVVIQAGSDKPWRALCEVIGRPELAADPRFATRRVRNENRNAANSAIEEWTQQFATEDVRVILEENDITVTRVLSIGEIVNHPHFQARGMITEMEDPRTGPVKMPNTAYQYAGAKADPRARPPVRGEHNQEILGSLLGYSRERIGLLYETGALHAAEKALSPADE